MKDIVADFNITRDIGELEISGLELFGNNTGFDFCECININYNQFHSTEVLVTTFLRSSLASFDFITTKKCGSFNSKQRTCLPESFTKRPGM